ncbi:GNAT family N-acetyltransferase [Methylobacterium iners]|uniref:GNAT family N-acetyltransferase n=2 Tax=Methylobacterium iners TaxID=418707 RepID=UPI00361E3B29
MMATAPAETPTERFEIVQGADRLTEVGPAWQSLWREAGALIFQSHGWIEAWWRMVADRERRTLLIVLAWRGDRLVAVLPLATCRRSGLRLLEWAAKDHTDYGDALIAGTTDPLIIARMWRHVTAARGFDFVYLNRLLPTAAARVLLSPAARSGLRSNHRIETSYRVTGPFASGDEWLQGHSKKTRQNYRRGQKFIAEQGALSFRLLPPDEPRGPLLERLAELKRKWLAATGKVSDLYDDGSQTLAALVDVLAEAGILRIFVLECDGTAIAIAVNFEQAGRMMAFVTAYDPAFERGSPGMVLMVDYIQWSIDRGLDMVDFLCGAEPFKQRFATSSVQMESATGMRTLPGAVAVLADRAVETARTLRARCTAPATAPARQAEAAE